MMRIIAGRCRGQKILCPKGNLLRPSSGALREAVYNIYGPAIDSARVLDVFAGSGAIGMEAISRGAAHCTFVEKHPVALQSIKKNLNELKMQEQGTILAGHFLTTLKRLAKQNALFDLIYVDPPYASKHEESFINVVLDLIDKGTLLSEKGTLFVEEAEKAMPDGSSLQKLTRVSSRKVGPASLIEYSF